MTVTLVGHSAVSFTDDKTGELIQGTNVFYLHNDVDTTGKVAAKKFFKNGAALPQLILGSEYSMEFGPKGKLQTFEPLHPAPAHQPEKPGK